MKLSSASLTILVLAICSVSAASAPGSWRIRATDFVKVNGLHLENSKGEPQYLTGINYWACLNLAADADQGGEYGRVVTELDQMQAVGINHLRIMAGSEGNPMPQLFRMNPPLQPSPGEYNEKIFVGLDRCLAEMAKRGMRATMTLNNQWQWSGGFAQYVSWTHGNEELDYPPSWNLSAPPQRAGPPGRGWGNYTTTGDWNNYTTYGDQFYTDDTAEIMFKAHIDKVLNRKNTVNGRIYREDATVMVWQLANEPQPKVPTTFLGPYGLQLPPDPSDPLLDWVDRISTYIKQRAPKQLISVGFEGKQGEWYWKNVHMPKNVDLGTAHCWVQNWGVYDMLNSSQANLDAAKAFATEFITNTSNWARDIGKPIFLEEFGMARDNWENNVTAGGYQYSSLASTTHKDNYYKHIIGLVMDSFKSKTGAFVGSSPWAYGGIYRPETERENEFGMIWAGDPPHEAPGWYDVYDTDFALGIIADQKRDIDAFLAQ